MFPAPARRAVTASIGGCPAGSSRLAETPGTRDLGGRFDRTDFPSSCRVRPRYPGLPCPGVPCPARTGAWH